MDNIIEVLEEVVHELYLIRVLLNDRLIDDKNGTYLCCNDYYHCKYRKSCSFASQCKFDSTIYESKD